MCVVALMDYYYWLLVIATVVFVGCVLNSRKVAKTSKNKKKSSQQHLNDADRLTTKAKRYTTFSRFETHIHQYNIPTYL